MADGTEANGISQASLWIAHHSEFHYYGVLKASQVVALAEEEWPCGLCLFGLVCADHQLFHLESPSQAHGGSTSSRLYNWKHHQLKRSALK